MKWFYPKATKRVIYLIPSALFVLLLVCYGTYLMVAESFQGDHDESWTINNYLKLIESQIFWDSIFLSLQVTLLATLLSLVLGLIVTRILFYSFYGQQGKLLVWVPMLIPHFVAAYMVLALFSQGGWLSSLAYHLGWIEAMEQFPILVNDRQGIGIILTYLWKQIPFVVLMLLPTYYQLNKGYADVVRTLGGGPWQVFKTTEWPWLCPVVLETGIVLFAFIFSAFEVPYLLGVTYPKMISVLAYQWFFEGDWSRRSMAMAAMMMITLSIFLISLLAFRSSQGHSRRILKGRG